MSGKCCKMREILHISAWWISLWAAQMHHARLQPWIFRKIPAFPSRQSRGRCMSRDVTYRAPSIECGRTMAASENGDVVEIRRQKKQMKQHNAPSFLSLFHFSIFSIFKFIIIIIIIVIILHRALPHLLFINSIPFYCVHNFCAPDFIRTTQNRIDAFVIFNCISFRYLNIWLSSAEWWIISFSATNWLDKMN